MISQVQGQKYLRWSRWAVLVLVLATGLLYSTFYYNEYDNTKITLSAEYLKDIAHEALPFIIAAVYGYALWGHKRFVPIYVRAFSVVGLAGGLLYVSLEYFGNMSPRYTGWLLGCHGDKICQVLVASEFMGAAAGFLMLAEVALTLKFGLYIPNATQQGGIEQGKGPETSNLSAPILVSGHSISHNFNNHSFNNNPCNFNNKRCFSNNNNHRFSNNHSFNRSQ
ncbi:hypothetical protein BG003_000493 [Podila horticola]|nr:hypothetical protein BG003_000493 [Podila horticola]